jgi:AhpD family alkylhydroperoxidase
MNIYEEFDKRRNEGNERVFAQNDLVFNRFFNLDTNAFRAGALDEKSKQLIGLSCSLMLRCNDCTIYHIREAVNCGANRQEINEAMNIALIIGGSIVVPHLRFALAALDELIGS